jgi:flavodoxin
MARILISYYSKNKGNNEVLARLVSTIKRSDIEKIETIKNKGIGSVAFSSILGIGSKIKSPKHNPMDYDALLLVSPIYVGNIPLAVINYLKFFKQKVPKIYFLSLCGGELRTNKPVMSIKKATGKTPESVLVLPIKNLCNIKDNAKEIMRFKATEEIIKNSKEFSNLMDFIENIK